MFNKLMKKLNGHAMEPASVTEALAQLGRDREMTRTEIADLNAKRKQALLDDATDAELDRIERQIDRANTRLEKLNLAEQPLREQLQAARSRVASEQKESDRKEFAAAFEPIAEDALALSRRAAELVAQADRMNLDGNVRQGAIPLLAFLAGWIEERRPDVQAARAALRREVPVRSPQAAAPARRAPPPALPASGTQHAVSIDPITQRELTASAPARKKPAPDDDSPLTDGNVRVVVMRSGYIAPDGEPSQAGRKIQLPRDLAMKAAQHGAIEITEGV